METRDMLLGQRFNHQHGGGVTRYQVDRPHRTLGFYECVAVRAVSGSHHFIGSIQAFSKAEIVKALGGRVMDTQCLKDEAGVCRNEFCRVHGALDPDEAAENDGLAWASEGEAARHPRERW